MPGLCYICNDENVAKYIHTPVEGGECVICHSPHSSPNPALLVTSPVASLCFECHDAEIAENIFNHQPVGEGNCQSCHNPHKSNNRSLLKSKMPGLCFSCHEKSGQELTAKNVHPPFEDDCRNCHLVHGSSEKKLLDQTGIEMCYNCHDDVKESIEKNSIVHGAVNKKSACINCHSPHASMLDKYLLDETTKLCLKCHNKSITTEKRLAKWRAEIERYRSADDLCPPALFGKRREDRDRFNLRHAEFHLSFVVAHRQEAFGNGP